MVTISSVRNVDGDQFNEYDLKGNSTDPKPTELGGKPIQTNSFFLELDTLDVYYYDDDGTWKKTGWNKPNAS